MPKNKVTLAQLRAAAKAAEISGLLEESRDPSSLASRVTSLHVPGAGFVRTAAKSKLKSRKLMLRVLTALARERQTCVGCRHCRHTYVEEGAGYFDLCCNMASPANGCSRLLSDGCDKFERRE